MDKRRYEYFMAIAEEKNISKAADRLFITQPSLSKFLINLEAELDTELFHRGKNILKITPAGERYMIYVRDVLSLHEDMVSDIGQINISSKNSLSFGITPWFGSFITSQVIEKFHSRFPCASLNIVEDSGLMLASLFEKKKIDVFLSTDAAISHIKKAQYQTANILKDRLLLIVPQNHPAISDINLKGNSWSRPFPINLRLFKNSKLITAKPNQLLTISVNNLIKKYNLTPESVISTQNINNIIRLTDSGLGISFIPQTYVKNGPPTSHSAFFTSDDPLFNYHWMAYYRQDNFVTMKRDLVRMIKDVCKTL